MVKSLLPQIEARNELLLAHPTRPTPYTPTQPGDAVGGQFFPSQGGKEHIN